MPANDPLLTKTPIFEARTNGYHVVRIPGLLVTANGVVLATGEARRGKGGDWDNNDVVMRRSLDNGQTWEPLRAVVENEKYGPGPISNFVMLTDREDGNVHALFCHAYSRVFHMASADDGASFSEPVEITKSLEAYRDRYPWRVIATGPDHGLQLRSGRMIVPIWMSDGSGKEMGKGNLGHRPSEVGVVYSDDHGKTWQTGDIVARTDERFLNPSETVPVELADGRVLFNIRTECDEHRRLISISPNGATDWTDPVFDDALLEPVCMAAILRLSWPEDGKSRILFSNPDNLDKSMRGAWSVACDRKNVSVKLSYDECETWAVSKVLEEGPSGYSDLAVTKDNMILCLYECGLAEGRMCDDKYLMLARFNLEWVTDGKDSLTVGD